MLGSVQFLHFVFFLRSGLSRRDAPEAIDDSQLQILKQNTLYYIVVITGSLETLNCVKQNGFIGKI